MKKNIKRIICASLATVMVSSLAIESGIRNADGADGFTIASASYTDVTGKMDNSSVIKENLNTSTVFETSKTKTYERRTVIVTLDGESVMEAANGENASDYLDSWAGQRTAEKIRSKQNAFLSSLKREGIDYDLTYRYDVTTNAVAIEVNTRYVSKIKEMSGVQSVEISRTYLAPQTAEGSTTTTTAQLNETSVYKTGIYNSEGYQSYGEGMVVAVLDTGLDYTHSAFQTMPEKLGMDETYVNGKLAANRFAAETKSGKELTAADVYVSDKVPFAYDYADDEPDVYPSYSNHGTHVAGIVAGYDPDGYTDKDGNKVNEEFIGVAPSAQLAIFKVFTDDLYDEDLGGAEAENILAALEDCVLLGVDVINMSLGTAAGFSTTDDGDEEGESLARVYASIQKAGISLICAASNDYSSAYGGTFGTNLSSNPDSGTIGSPSSFASALSVASISGQMSKYILANEGTEYETAVFYEESRDENSNPFDFAEGLLGGATTGEFEYVVVPGVGQASDYTSSIKKLFAEKPRIALIKRGNTTFEEKVNLAMRMGAAGVIVYNNVAGVIRMNLGEIENPCPSASINMRAGNALVQAAGGTGKTGVLKFSTQEYLAGPFMSEFSSWGTTPDLKLKPEITAHGGEITSTVPGGYDEQSGTSMAAPNMAGFTALLRGYIESDLGIDDLVEITRLANQLMMSTATTAYDADHLPYSPRKQGAGLASLVNTMTTKAYLYTESEENDYRPKIELFDDPDETGVYEMQFKVKNFGSTALSFKAQSLFMTETLASDGLAVAEQAYMLDGEAKWTVNGAAIGEGEAFSVEAGKTATISVTLTLSEEEKNYIRESFENGMYIEGFLKLLSASEGQCDLSLPFVGFFGDWTAAPMLDYTAFEVSASEQDSAVLEEDKLQASIWATQPYATYYNEEYIIPMGGFVYLQDENADQIYTEEEYCSVSGYNIYIDEDGVGNYLTSTAVKAVYAGLFRNARTVEYGLYDTATGELIYEDTINRVGKAYSGGGSAVPANVEVNLVPEEYGLVENSQYTMKFAFYQDYTRYDREGNEIEQVAGEGDTFEFSFYVDYSAPVLEDVRIRYSDYQDGNKTKQRIYLDLDVYDNHYAQSVLLCYVDKDDLGQENVLKLATDYVTPVYDPVKNGTTTVSIEITDIYSLYKDSLYIQIDDYALNNTVYQLNLAEANNSVAPDTFELAEGEDEITVGVYETHKVALAYEGSANLSNFTWSSNKQSVAKVKNGEIVGMKPGTAKITVTNARGVTKTIDVTVVASDKKLSVPTVTFGIVQTDLQSLTQASGSVSVSAGKDFSLQTVIEPWYYPENEISFIWSSSNESVATVDQSGNVHTIKKGTAIISATMVRGGEETKYDTVVSLRVQDEFTIDGYTLTDYNGDGGVVVIPSDKNIMYIGEKAFEYNDNITAIVIPKTVVEIHEKAFRYCTALKEVYFVDEEAQPIADADITMISQQAFYGCTALEKVDFSNTKTLTVAHLAFAGCTSLKELVKETNIGTMHDSAFAGCTSLKEVDLSGLHMSGTGVFSGCTSLASVTTDKFTAIGPLMFSGCTALRSIEIKTPKVGESAFNGCICLTDVTFHSVLPVDIGANAFNGCTALKSVTATGGEVRSIGDKAFANCRNLTSFTLPVGLKTIGAEILGGSGVTEIVLTDLIDLTVLSLTGVPFAGLTVTVAENSAAYVEENGVIYDKAKTKAILATTASGAYVLPDTVEEIAAYAFAGSKITSVKLNAALKKLGEGAFANSLIESVDFSDAKIDEISEKAFNGAKLTTVEIPAGVTKIGAYAFTGTPLTKITCAGKKLTTIGDYAFAGCTALQTVVVCDTVTEMGDRVFANCGALQTVTLPSLELLGSGTFYGASALESVTFGENAKTAGTNTFVGTRVKTVAFGDQTTELGERVFYTCAFLETVDLNNITTIGDHAFAGCSSLKTVTGLEKVTTIGNYAFNGCYSIPSLSLTEAKTIGDYAFAIEGAETGYQTLTLGKAESVGKLAFLGGNFAAVEIPESLQKIGAGAFAACENLTAITVANGNASFFAENGVLYRTVEAEETVYELVAYPAAKTMEKQDGKAVYEVKEGTATIAGYAFYGLTAGALEKITLPYSLKKIGDSAFFESGVKEYVFESIQAPVLEAEFRQEVLDYIEGNTSEYAASVYRGYFYRNFNEYFALYSEFGEAESDLTIYYPENGEGYDSHAYRGYFGTRISLGVLIDDYTRECKELIADLSSAETVSGWMNLAVTDENKQMVAAFSERVKTARGLYAAIKDEAQLAFVTEAETEKLLAVENALREVKGRFGIVVKVSKLTVEAGSYKSEYLVGETFDLTGIKMTVVYDDNSTAEVPVEEITLLTTGELDKYDRVVSLQAYGKTINIKITVAEDVEEKPPVIDPPNDSSSSSSQGSQTPTGNENGGCGSAVSALAGAVTLIFGAAVVLLKKRKD